MKSSIAKRVLPGVLAAAVGSFAVPHATAQIQGFATLPPGAINNVQAQVIAKVVQQKLRDARGSLRMQSTERKFVFDEDHEVKAIVDAPRYFSQTLIEETALAANQAVGDLFRKRGLPTIYRVHPEKDLEEIESIVQMLS